MPMSVTCLHAYVFISFSILTGEVALNEEDLRLFLPKADLERLMHLLSKTDPSFFLLYHNFSLEIFPINDSLFVFLFLPSWQLSLILLKKKKKTLPD